MCLYGLSNLFAEISYDNKKNSYVQGSFALSKKSPCTTRKYNPLTLICYIRSKKISLPPADQAPEPPLVVVFVQHLDDITAAYGQFIRPISSVVIKRDNLENTTVEGLIKRRKGLHATEPTARVDTYYLLNRGRICFHMNVCREVVRKALMEKNGHLDLVAAILADFSRS